MSMSMGINPTPQLWSEDALYKVLKSIPQNIRDEVIHKVLRQIEEDERRQILLAEFQKAPIAELERLVAQLSKT